MMSISFVMSLLASEKCKPVDSSLVLPFMMVSYYHYLHYLDWRLLLNCHSYLWWSCFYSKDKPPSVSTVSHFTGGDGAWLSSVPFYLWDMPAIDVAIYAVKPLWSSFVPPTSHKLPLNFVSNGKKASDGNISKATRLFPRRVCDVFCYHPGDFQQCGNAHLYQQQSVVTNSGSSCGFYCRGRRKGSLPKSNKMKKYQHLLIKPKKTLLIHQMINRLFLF